MNGKVDPSGRALLVLDVRKSQATESHQLTVWVDTAFTGELVIPRGTIERTSAVVGGDGGIGRRH